MKRIVAALALAGAFPSIASAGNCTLSKEFQVFHAQVLDGVLEDSAGAVLPGIELELLSDKRIVAHARTSNDGHYSFGEVDPDWYKLHIRYSGNYFCAPKVKCNDSGCSIERQVKLNPKIPAIVVE
jgi:hypothetical protein